MEAIKGAATMWENGEGTRDSSLDLQVSKRRKLRKGTFSCLNCKRRKVRCEVGAGSSAACAACQRYGQQCIGQDYDETADNSQNPDEERVGNIEHLVEDLLRQRALQPASGHTTLGEQRSRLETTIIRDRQVSRRVNQEARPMTPAVKSIKRPCSPPLCLAISEDLLSRCRSLSGHLNSILPAPSTASRILTCSQSPFEMIRHSPTESIKSRNDLQAMSTHPIVFARKLLQLALGLQSLDADLSQQLDQISLDAPTRDVADHYADNARHVTSQDVLVNSADGLETLILEAVYQIHTGNMDRAWLIFRRAVGIAQLLCVAESDDPRSQFNWFRLVQADRALSLILGRPCAPVDNESFASNHLLSKYTPTERLDRVHVAVHGRIIARNIGLQKQRTGARDTFLDHDYYAETQDIDLALKNASRSLPVSWWAIPDVKDAASQAEASEMFARLLAQLHHFYILLFLHEPCFIAKCHHLQPPTDGQRSDLGLTDERKTSSTYSKLAMISAARDMLARFHTFRKFPNVPASNSSLAHKGYLAAMALLLVHIEGHKAGHANVFEHQRPTDLRMISDVVDSVDDMSSVDRHVPTHFVKTVRRLMQIEEEAADGACFDVVCEDCIANDDDCARNVVSDLQWSVPFFGTLRMVHQSRDGESALPLLTGRDSAGTELDTLSNYRWQEDYDVQDLDFLALLES